HITDALRGDVLSLMCNNTIRITGAAEASEASLTKSQPSTSHLNGYLSGAGEIKYESPEAEEEMEGIETGRDAANEDSGSFQHLLAGSLCDKMDEGPYVNICENSRESADKFGMTEATTAASSISSVSTASSDAAAGGNGSHENLVGYGFF